MHIMHFLEPLKSLVVLAVGWIGCRIGVESVFNPSTKYIYSLHESQTPSDRGQYNGHLVGTLSFGMDFDSAFSIC